MVMMVEIFMLLGKVLFYLVPVLVWIVRVVRLVSFFSAVAEMRVGSVVHRSRVQRVF